jgi:hypothetical protein
MERMLWGRGGEGGNGADVIVGGWGGAWSQCQRQHGLDQRDVMHGYTRILTQPALCDLSLDIYD